MNGALGEKFHTLKKGGEAVLGDMLYNLYPGYFLFFQKFAVNTCSSNAYSLRDCCGFLPVSEGVRNHSLVWPKCKDIRWTSIRQELINRVPQVLILFVIMKLQMV